MESSHGKITVSRLWTGWFLLLTIVALGCKEHPPADADPAPAAKVDGDKLDFPTNAPQLTYLDVQTPQPRTNLAIGLYGRLAWDDDFTVRIFSPVAGRVINVRGEINQTVARGDVLATFESPDFGQAQSDTQKAASDLALADRTISRLRDLLEHGAAAKKDVESAEADYAKAKSEYERANAQMMSLSLGHTNSAPGTYDLCSPINGMVVDKNISPGQQVRSDQILANAPQFVNPLFVVTDPAKLWLFLDVTEMDASSLNPNQEVLIHTKAFPDKTFHGRVEIIGGGLDATTRTIKARCVVDNSEKLLRAETYVTADVSAGAVTGVDVSTKAVFLKDNQHYVFVETAPGKFQRRVVKLGLESNGRTVITDGLSAGDKVVMDGCLLLEAMLEGDNS